MKETKHIFNLYFLQFVHLLVAEISLWKGTKLLACAILSSRCETSSAFWPRSVRGDMRPGWLGWGGERERQRRRASQSAAFKHVRCSWSELMRWGLVLPCFCWALCSGRPWYSPTSTTTSPTQLKTSKTVRIWASAANFNTDKPFISTHVSLFLCPCLCVGPYFGFNLST